MTLVIKNGKLPKTAHVCPLFKLKYINSPILNTRASACEWTKRGYIHKEFNDWDRIRRCIDCPLEEQSENKE